MNQTGDHPSSVAYWDIDEESGEVKNLGSYTNWPDE